MSSRSRHRPLWFAAAVMVVMAAFSDRVPAAQPLNASQTSGLTPLSKNDEAAVAGFMERVNQYVALHKKLEATLKKLPEAATPKQIDQNERALNALIRSARANAKQGDLFTPQITAVIKRVMAQVFGGPDGQMLRSSVMDENVKEMRMTVNQRFPDGIPMTTIPPAILKALPELPEQMQYRFVASQFVLLDPHANVVADFIPAVLPPKKLP